MNACARLLLCAATAPWLLLAARVGIDSWVVAQRDHQVEQGRRETIQTREAVCQVDQRVGRRGQVIDDLCGGRIGLLEAAARFRDLSATPAGGPDLRVCFPGDSEGERYCRQVIQWVRARAEGEPSDLAVRLEEELDYYLNREGQIQLPR
jgi:hypothetical protein